MKRLVSLVTIATMVVCMLVPGTAMAESRSEHAPVVADGSSSTISGSANATDRSSSTIDDSVNAAGGSSGMTLQEISEQLSDPSNDPFDYVDDEARLQAAEEEFPERIDLRDFDGQNYITPVKNQGPFGTCWGFAAIAAAESSILSNEELNKDEKTGKQLYSTSLKQGEDGLTVLDMSEKHLAYFVVTPLDDPGNPQDGEGTYLNDGQKVQDGLNNGGLTILSSNSFASGIGPNLESRDECLQYKGGIRQKDGTIDYSHPDTDWGMIDGEWARLTYSDEDDWSLDESWRMKQSYVLKESYMLPSPSGRSEKDQYEYVYNPAGTAAIKEQLNQKRAVEIAFCWANAVYSDDGEKLPTINKDTWAYYMPAPNGGNHAVTVVGYDDNYPRENFATKPPADMFPDGRHEGATNGGNGAWLIKNSWGSGEEEFPNKDDGTWGLFQGQDKAPYEKTSDVHTGYFWMSYYDQSLEMPEALSFDKSNVGKSYILDEHDYMPVYEMAGATTEGETAMANVFTAEYGEKLEQISFFTAAPGTKIYYTVYLLQDEFKDPTDGTIVSYGTEEYKYGGFHKVDLKDPAMIARGQHYSIVITEVVDSKYAINMPIGLGKETATEMDTTYQKGIVNEKESYVFTDGEWKDYSDKALQEKLLGREDKYEFDNFPIKGYCTETNNDIKMQIKFDFTPDGHFENFCTYPGAMNKGTYYVTLVGSSDLPKDAEVKWSVTNDDMFTLEPDRDEVTLTVKGIEGECYLECAIDGVGSARVPVLVTDLILFRIYPYLDEHVYTGKPIKPDYNVDSMYKDNLTEGKEYVLKLENNVKCGKAKMTALPNQPKVSGEPTGSFIIVPAKAAVKKLTPGKGSLKVTAKNQKKSGLTGYEISYKIKGSKKWKTTTSTKNVKTIKNLKKGKKYQVRVRGYVKVGGKKHYGAWSKVKTSKKIK